jgi:hypothetical protein
MKKLTIISIISVVILSILACGGTSEVTEEVLKPVTEEIITDIETEDQENQEESTPIQIDTEESPSSTDIHIEEQVVFDQEGIKITIKSLDIESSFFGPELKVLIENNNAIDITVQVRKASINDIMVDAMFSSDVATGKKINDEITFMSSELEDAGITTIKEIEFSFHIFDTDSWDTIIDSDMIHIETSADDAFVQEFDDSGFLAVDSNGVKIVIKKLDSEDSFWGADVYVYIENNTNQDITVQVRDVSIDGFMVDPIFSSDVVSGKKAFDSISFMESDLVDNEITDIKTIELKFHVFDMDSWDTIFDSDIVSVTFD